MRVIALAITLAAVLGAQGSEPGGQRFRSGVDLVTVDAVVLDKDGQPVSGLTKADFAVFEEGRAQEITEFEAVDAAAFSAGGPASRPAPPVRRVSTNTRAASASTPGRSFAIVFDDMNLTRQQADESRKVLRRFLDESLGAGDGVTLVATSGAAWLNARMPEDRDRVLAALGRLEGRFFPDTSAERMSDYEAMRIHQYGDTIVEARVRRRYENYRVMGLEPTGTPERRQDDMPRVGPSRGDAGVIAPYIQSRAESTYAAAVSRNRSALELLARAVDSLKLARGRKSAVLLSKGFIYDVDLRGFKDVSRAAREANVAIYFIDARGLEATTSQFTADAIGPTDPRDVGWAQAGIELEAAGAVSVAEESGGFAVRNTNDLSAGLRRIGDESRRYYLLGYVSRNTRRDGRFRNIEVRLTSRKGLRVRARRGYYAPDSAGPAVTRTGLDPDVQRALDTAYDLGDIPLRATALVFDESRAGQAGVLIAAEVDVRRFLFDPQHGRLTDVLELAVAATHRETGEVSRFGQTIEMNVLPDTLKSLEQTWYPVAREMTLPPGPYQARVVVRDRNSGRIGSVTHEFEVPPLDGFRVSSPILSDAVEARAAGTAAPGASAGAQPPPATAKPVVIARRTFATGATLFCQFSVFGAAVDPATRAPQVSSSWSLRRAAGGEVRRTPPRAIARSPDGTLLRLYGISLSGLVPGDYELVIDVRDEIGVDHVQLREPFAVQPGVGVSP